MHIEILAELLYNLLYASRYLRVERTEALCECKVVTSFP
jgi:hypothetical protein